VIIQGTENYTDEYILGKLGIKKGEPLTYDQFSKGINQLAATQNFKSIQYKFVDRKTIEFKLKESDVSSFVKIGAHFDDLYKTAALLNVTSKHLLFDNDVISGDLILGDNIRYNFDYFIDNGFHWSYGIHSRYNHFDKSIFKSTFESFGETETDTKERTKYNDFTNQIFVQSAISNAVAIRLGAETKYLRIFTESVTNNEEIKNFYDNSTYGNVFAEVKVDTYDKAFLPKKGFFLDVNYKGYLVLINDNGITNNFTPFTQLKGKIGFAYTFKDKLTAHIISEGGITIGENQNKVHNFHLGGNNENFINNFTSFYGYDVGDFSGKGYLKSAMSLSYELFKNNHLSFTANAARAEEDIINDGRLFENTKLGYAVGYSIESFLGPLEIKYSWSPDTSNNIWFFNLGFWF
jgi:NTE family protein